MSCVLITGATSGIGRQLALDYAEQGWHVIACGRNENALSKLSQQSANITAAQFDVTSLEETHRQLSTLSHKPSLWIFNAGNCEYINDGNIDADLFARIINVNVLGIVNCLQIIQKQLTRGHHVVLVGSIASEVALPRAEAYGASKAAVGYLARSLSLALEPKGIRVSTVFPGFVETPLTDKNDFAMPMIVTTKRASADIRCALAQGKRQIYFPKRFTAVLRLISLLPYTWQHYLVSKFLSVKN